jgi:uroporphyrin-III C-methyltransferase
MEYAKIFDIDCEIISGVTSAIAAPASVGIPVTSRGYAESFWVITGTTKKGELSRDIELAAQSTATVVILMGMSKLAEICEVFTQHGKSEMPMAIIQNGTRKNVKSVVGTVSTIIEKSVLENIANPAVIVIGEVVSLSEQFNEQLIINNYQLK